MSKWDNRNKQNKGSMITAGEAIESIQNLLETAQMAAALKTQSTPDEQTLLGMVQSTMIMMAAQTASIFSRATGPAPAQPAAQAPTDPPEAPVVKEETP